MPVELPVLDIGQHIYKWFECTRCVIGGIAHKHVFYRGVVPCDVLFVGEAPGKTEDLVGQPFVGKSGKLLDKWIMEALLKISQPGARAGVRFAITNTVCCRPTNRRGGPNRPPSMQETSNCSERLQEFVAIARPAALVSVGRTAEGAVQSFDLPWMRIYHPSYALRNGESDYKLGPISHVQIAEIAGVMAKYGGKRP